MSHVATTLRTRIGALALDLPRSLHALAGDRWIHLGNRGDRFEKSTKPPGVRCLGAGTSELHLCRAFPNIGRRVLRQALRQWPIHKAHEVSFSTDPAISFLIPFRGRDRLPQLISTIESIAAQGEAVECIVIEQDCMSSLPELPGNTRLVHAPHPRGDPAWRKCYAFNRGAEQARGRILVCHDADILAPVDYASEILRRFSSPGVKFAALQRFLFYIDEACSARFGTDPDEQSISALHVDAVKQNWKGGTLAIGREAFFEIGGYDEEFIGWTGEDTEFADRAEALEGWRFGYLPFVHLWHAPQTGRVDQAQREAAAAFTAQRLAIPREERIRKLATPGARSR